MKQSYSLKCLLVLLVTIITNKQTECASPNVYYANVGDTITLQCSAGGGNFACYSSYAFQNQIFKMVNLFNSPKYQVSGSGSIGIANVQATDAGFYACASDCNQMRLDQVSFYLQPTQNGQPTNLGSQFIAIPPYKTLKEDKQSLYVVVLNENNLNEHGLNTGEIIGLVIGCVFLFLIALTLILLFICLSRRKRQKREQQEAEEKKEKDSTSVDYSTIERDVSDLPGGEKKSLTTNKITNSADIRIKDIRGPNIYQPGTDLSKLNPKDLPSIDIHSNQSNSQRNSKQGSYNASYQQQQQQQLQNPSNRSYQNQLDGSTNLIPRPNNRKDSENGIIPPPPNKMPVNKIQFPSRHSSSSQPSNENLGNVIKDLDDVFGRAMDSNNYQFDGSEEQIPQQQQQRQNSTGGIDLEGGDGGVTVVSTRTPLRTDVPPPVSRLQQLKQQQQQQQQLQMKQIPPHLSYSQRIETTSTPLQLPPPSASLRAPFNGSKLSSTLKDGATDV